MTYKPKSDDQPFDNNTCPTPEQSIEHFLKNTKLRKPGMFPSDPFQAARYWMAHQEPANDFTEAATPPVTKGGSWATPYHDRLVYTLWRFMQLKGPFQVHVIENIEKGVIYRGDPIKRYLSYVEEFNRMKAHPDREKYIDEGFIKMRRALAGMVV
ncbi:MAG: hypothetical protein WBC75_09365 [Dehalococcoidales bacterium]